MLQRSMKLALFVLAACARASQPPEPVAELHDGAGVTTFALLRSDEGLKWRDTRTSVEGRPSEVAVAQSGALELLAERGRVSLRRVDGVLRVGDERGVPLGRVRTEGEAALLFDAGGTLLVRAQRAGGRVAVSSREGALVGFVTGSLDPATALERAVLCYLPGLGPAEKAALVGAPPASWPRGEPVTRL